MTNKKFCEICGKKTETLYSGKIAGGTLKICKDCLKYNEKNFQNKDTEINRTTKNKISDKKITFNKFKHKSSFKEKEEQIVENYLELIKKEMQKKEINVKMLAKLINEKESTISKIINGKLDLDINLAKKLEQFFKISLVYEVEVNNIDNSYIGDEENEEGFTIGDFISINKK